jgi:transcriptional regulator with XRE-family HTH domain
LAAIDQATLAERANVSRQAVIAIEGDESETMDFRRVAVLRKLQAVLENEFGIEFQKATKSAGPGVRLRNPKT